ncbi:NAD-dependent epimerase/dehydratase family protein [Terribacillus saccharophilus]|uniref:NAD-dependent epimerase/dehydratase family protein n=1 Tax=Terribacillus saccharophilus TaxID=361277 RepID=UPI002DD0D16C|nr:NAD-dependent epimerase/dehydratase family protein [Terribacillus saccharophilus]
MKAIVTGGAGFIGSHLVNALLEEQVEVVVLDDLSASDSGNEAVPQHVKLYQFDVKSADAYRAVIEEQPDIVFHLAAQADVTKSILAPVYDADVNIGGTINMLEASRTAGVKKFIFASTSAVYGNVLKVPITEDDATVPISFYGISKLSAERYIQLFHDLYGLPYTILRYGNVYGPGQKPKGEGGVVAVFLERLKQKEPIIIHGDGSQSRDFIYVKDIVSANLAAMNQEQSGIFHASTGTSTSILDLAACFKKLNASLEIKFTSGRTGDISHSCLCNERAAARMGWKPTTDIYEGIKNTWHLT